MQVVTEKKQMKKANINDLTGYQLLFAEQFGIDEYIKAKHKMHTQRWHAIKNRNLNWEFTDDQWFQMWFESGKWLERGTSKGKYCMCRYNDVGPYSITNVKIDLHGQNTREAGLGNTWGKAHKGRINYWGKRKNELHL